MIWNNYTETTRLMLHVVDERFERIADQTRQQLHNLYAPVTITVDLLAWQRLTLARSLDERLNSLHYLREALSKPIRRPHCLSVMTTAIFSRYDPCRWIRHCVRHSMPRTARYLVQSVERDAAGATIGTFLFYDNALNLLRRDPRPDYGFEPRSRPWYRMAQERTERVQTDPYLFFTSREVGATIALCTAAGTAVVGADLTLNQVSAVLAASR